MTRKNGELKRRCWLAKQRLKMGYWESLKREQSCADEVDVRSIAVEYARRTRDVDGTAYAPSAEEERMYRKVCEILDSTEVTMNPIGQLIDRSVYDGLDPAGKQRYILELSEKFRELQARYYREKTGS